MPLTHAAPDYSEADQHHLHRMGDDVLGAETLEAIDANLRHAGSGPFMKADREIEVLGRGPEWLVIGVVYHLVVVGVGPQKTAPEAQFLFRKTHLGDRQIDILHRQHRNAEQPIRIGLAIVGEPAVVGAAGRSGKLRIVDRAGKQPEAWIEKGGIDAVGIHVGDPLVRIEPAWLAVLVFHRIGGDDPLTRTDRANGADAAFARAYRVLRYDEPFPAVYALDDARRPIAEFWIHIVIP